jgi:hypothetical protein
MDFKAGGMYIYHCALIGLPIFRTVLYSSGGLSLVFTAEARVHAQVSSCGI